MADKTIKLEVVTPEKVVLTADVEAIKVPASLGYLGVLPNHAPLVTGLQVGVITFKQNGKTNKMATSGGFMEVVNNKAVVLADTAELGDEIDLQRAMAARDRAKQRLIERHPGIDLARAEVALRKALTRIKAGE